MSLTYKDSGVDIEKGDALVEKIKTKVKSTYGSRVKGGVGGFACLYEVGDRLLAAGTDGVGTKLKLAFDCDKHDTVGIDLVAMCVNDILCTGARPLFFMDYLATGKLQLETSEAIIEGIVQGCLQSESALIGGETAEMPGMYGEGEYDLAGFAVGEVFPDKILGGDKVKPGHILVGLASSGVHSNGFSLVRKVLEKANADIEKKREFLTPTKIYWNDTKEVINQGLVSGMSHVTGGGVFNIPRMNEDLGYEIEKSVEDYFEAYSLPVFKWIKDQGNIQTEEMLKTFNCGIGLILTVPEENLSMVKKLVGECFILGKVSENKGLRFAGVEFSEG